MDRLATYIAVATRGSRVGIDEVGTHGSCVPGPVEPWIAWGFKLHAGRM